MYGKVRKGWNQELRVGVGVDVEDMVMKIMSTPKQLALLMIMTYSTYLPTYCIVAKNKQGDC